MARHVSCSSKDEHPRTCPTPPHDRYRHKSGPATRRSPPRVQEPARHLRHGGDGRGSRADPDRSAATSSRAGHRAHRHLRDRWRARACHPNRRRGRPQRYGVGSFPARGCREPVAYTESERATQRRHWSYRGFRHAGRESWCARRRDDRRAYRRPDRPHPALSKRRHSSRRHGAIRPCGCAESINVCADCQPRSSNLAAGAGADCDVTAPHFGADSIANSRSRRAGADTNVDARANADTHSRSDTVTHACRYPGAGTNPSSDAAMPRRHRQ
jgi:hypothetical protein